MEIVRYINGVSVSEGELSNVKAVTREMTEAVNEARRRVEGSAISASEKVKTDG
ncbi:MAG: hypothetical protein IJY94_01225 [Clostridia bacterium]|nr:hypothetical protein [Clostridia bacterium]